MDPKDILAALSAPFEVNEVKWKPQAVKGNRALAIGYVDARVVQDRLDDAIGVENWQDEYAVQPDGSVVCKLSVRIGGEWIAKMDVGSPSEQPDGGDRLKAAFSDALKRAAIKFGIGRYLYRLPSQWCDYDPVKKMFTRLPELPAWARPGPTTHVRQQVETRQTPALPAKSDLPATGAELHRRLRDYDAKLAAAKKCPVGALLGHVATAGESAGYGSDITTWTGPAIPFAVEAVKAFEAGPTKAA